MAEAGWNRPIDQSPVSVGATATALITVAERAGKFRKGVSITPMDGDIWIGGAAVSSGGTPVYQGTTRDFPTEQGQIYAIRQAASDVATNVTVWY